MTVRKASDVAAYARSAGIPLAHAGEAVAIAWAESGLDDQARGYNYNNDHTAILSTDRGLWQINDYYHSEVSNDCAFDPQCNANAMARISKHGTDWGPWSTYNDGSYSHYLTPASAAAAIAYGGISPAPQLTNAPFSPVQEAINRVQSGENPLQAVRNTFDSLLNYIKANALQ